VGDEEVEGQGTARSAKITSILDRKPIDWIDLFLKETADVNSPEVFRLWSAISTVGAALERRVWTRVKKSTSYPNLYVVLVAGPGVGKTEATWRSRTILKSLAGQHHVGSVSLTSASLIDAIEAAERTVLRPTEIPATKHFNHLSLIINELGVFLPEYDRAMMARLTDLWDGQEYSEERRMNKGEVLLIERPTLSILAGCTPDYLNSTLPEGAWNQGFMTRVLLVYSGERSAMSGDIFNEIEEEDTFVKHLKPRLKEIAELWGPMRYSEDVRRAFSAWIMAGLVPVPDHPKLFHYTARRVQHLIKLCMVASCSRSNELVVEMVDYQRALGWLLDMEANIPDAFRAMSSSGDARVIEEAWHFLYTEYRRHQKPIPEARLFAFISERTPSHNVERVIHIMLKSRKIDRVAAGFKPLQLS
jgi:hypothetical protein